MRMPTPCYSPPEIVAGILGVGGAAASLFGPKPKTPGTPAPIQQPTGTPDTNKPQQSPSFLAAAAAPQTQTMSGSKTLLGA